MGGHQGSGCDSGVAVLKALLQCRSPLTRTAPHPQAQSVKFCSLLLQAGQSPTSPLPSARSVKDTPSICCEFSHTIVRPHPPQHPSPHAW